MTRSREAAPIRRRHHLSLSALVLLAVLAVAASGFAPAAPAEPGDAVAPVGGTSVDELLRGPVIDGRDDPRARAAAMQTFVTQRWELPDTSTPSPAADAADAAVADTAAADLESEYNIYPRPAADLDGDGGADVIINGSSYPDGPRGARGPQRRRRPGDLAHRERRTRGGVRLARGR